jgi:hypothetical protein
MLTWDVKARFLVDLYQRLLDGRAMPQEPIEPMDPMEQRRAA